MNPVRSAAAIVGAPLLLGFIDATLSSTLVNALGQGAPADEAAFLAIRNRTPVLVAMVVMHALASALVGYIGARIAGAHEVRHALAAAALLTFVYASSVMADDQRLPPMWVRLAVLVVTPPAIVGGASIRAQVRALQPEEAGPARPADRT